MSKVRIITHAFADTYRLPLDSITHLVDIKGTSAANLFGVGENYGQDGWGDYWAAPGVDAPFSRRRDMVCIGRPGFSFVFEE